MARYKGKFERTDAPRNTSTEAGRVPQESPAGKQTKKSKMPTSVRIVLIALLVIVILVAAVMMFANYFLNKINRDSFTGDESLSHTDLLEEGEVTDQEDSTEVIEKVWEDFEDVKDMPMLETSDKIVNFLLIGSDRRGGSGNGNSDSMMIVTLNKETKKIHITSLMRGCFVIYPEGLRYTDGMLNWAYAWGGAQTLIETVELNFKVDIDHYVSVDFESFQDVVDAMGGVELTLTQKEAYYVNNRVEGSYLNEGTQILNGEQALTFSRCRGAEAGDNDFRRTSRQRDVIEAMIRKVGSLSLGELTSLANALLPAVTTDMTNTEILSEAVNVADYASYEMDQLLIPMENQSGETYTGMMYKYGAEMYAIDWSTNLPALQEFINS